MLGRLGARSVLKIGESGLVYQTIICIHLCTKILHVIFSYFRNMPIKILSFYGNNYLKFSIKKYFTPPPSSITSLYFRTLDQIKVNNLIKLNFCTYPLDLISPYPFKVLCYQFQSDFGLYKSNNIK
jgi:hypothetical protein